MGNQQTNTSLISNENTSHYNTNTLNNNSNTSNNTNNTSNINNTNNVSSQPTTTTSNPAHSSLFHKRLIKELEILENSPPPNLKLIYKSPQLDIIHISILCNSQIYNNETYTVRLRLVNYPFSPPITTFINPVPIHPHVYSNGHICMSLLTTDWTPALTVSGLVLSLLSMLNSSTEKKKPENDALYSKMNPMGSEPIGQQWIYDDDKA